MTRYPCGPAHDGHCGYCGTPGHAALDECPARLRADLDEAEAKLERVRDASTAAEMAAHLRERDDLGEVLAHTKAAVWIRPRPDIHVLCSLDGMHLATVTASSGTVDRSARAHAETQVRAHGWRVLP